MNNWKVLKGYEGLYEINKLGNIKSFHKRHLKKTIISKKDRGGYIATIFSKQSKATTHFVHRLVAEAFIPNPANKKFINHKNGNKQDNRIENLEWVTHSENMKHAYKTGLIKNKSVPVIDNCSGHIFSGTREASLHTGINYYTLKGYLSGNRTNPTCLGYLYPVAA